MSLTKWWELLEADLVRLRSQGLTNQNSALQTLETIANIGVRIEQESILSAQTKDKNIREALTSLGSPYSSDLASDPQYLPNVSTPQELLLAVCYFHHLNRFQAIDESNNPLILNGVISKKTLVAETAQKLKERIDAYCSLDANLATFKLAFQEVEKQAGATLFEKLTSLLAELPLEEKLIIQLEADAAEAIQNNLDKQMGLIQVFDDLDLTLKKKEKILRDLSSSIKFIEELNANFIDPIKLATPNYPINSTKENALIWEKIKSQYALNKPSNLIVSATRDLVSDALSIAKLPFKAFNFFTSNTLGYFTPQIVNNTISTVTTTVGDLYNSIIPSTNHEMIKNSLIISAKTLISDLADSLNNSQEQNRSQKLSGNDFESMSSQEIQNLADKIAVVRNIIHIQKTIELYRQKQNTGIVTMTQMSFFGPIIKLLSKTSFRRFIYDRILLSLEAEKLSKNLAILVQQVDQNVLAIDQVNPALHTALNLTKTNSGKIKNTSVYTFFKELDKDLQAERDQAAIDLEAVIDHASFKSGLVNQGS